MTTAEEKMSKDYSNDWLGWIKDWLFINPVPWPDDLPPEGTLVDQNDMPLWSKQVEIIEALQKHKRVAVKSCHGPGKTYTAAVAALTMLNVLHAIGLTTAPLFRQVRRQLWGEIHNIYNRAEVKLNAEGLTFGAKLNQTSIEYDGKWYLEGFSTDEPSNISGFHERRVFLILDEACLLEKEIYDVIDAILTSEYSYVLAIGNPIDPLSPFKRLFEPNSGYYPIKITADEIPNIKHWHNIYEALTSWDWPEKMAAKHGKTSSWYVSRVEGEFPEENKDALVPLAYLEQSMQRAQEIIDNEAPWVSLGIDVARMGPDSTTFIGLRSDGLIETLDETEKQRETETAGRAVVLLREKKFGCINVDDIGLGGGVTDILLENNEPVRSIIVSESPPEFEEDAELFLNKRAFYFWKLRKGIIDGKYFIADPIMADQIHKLMIEYASKGKIKIIAKDKFKTKWGKSPDLADGAMLAISETDSLVDDRSTGISFI